MQPTSSSSAAAVKAAAALPPAPASVDAAMPSQPREPASDPAPLEFVPVRTTLPAAPFFPETTAAAAAAAGGGGGGGGAEAAGDRPILTDRLILRRLAEADLPALHALRTQPEVMAWTALGRVDASPAETRERVAAAFGGGQFNFVLCLRGDGTTTPTPTPGGEVVGVGGCHREDGELGWPVVGYMLRREAWGRGYGTEFLRAFVDAYWALPREARDVRVERATVVPPGGGSAGIEDDGQAGIGGHAGGGGGVGADASIDGGGNGIQGSGNGIEGGGSRCEPAEELLTAVTVPENKASQRVLEKAGFRLVRTWREPDMRDPRVEVDLLCYACSRPGPVDMET